MYRAVRTTKMKVLICLVGDPDNQKITGASLSQYVLTGIMADLAIIYEKVNLNG